jgi:hypothetical protein
MTELAAFEERHLRLIEVVAEVFAESGRWPRYPYVEAVLDHRYGLDFESVVADLPPRTVWWPAGLGGQADIIAGAPALAAIPALSDDLARFVAIVSMLAAREFAHTPSPHDPGELVVERVEVLEAAGIAMDDQLAITRLLALVRAEDVAFVGGQVDAEWTLVVDRRIRAFREVQALADYNARRWTPAVAQVVSLPQVAPSIFIIMPFEDDWSDNVHDMIKQACAEVAATVEGLTWQRADGISEPGRITDQIVNAILNADLIVADTTGYNPNVMFELGFADAARKPIVVLNQNVTANPFDIKDWRAIVYDTAKLADGRTELVSFIRGGLAVAGHGS